VILATATPATAALQSATKTVPIVFAMVADPVSAGFVASLARPGGNITGFTNIEYAIGAKWLELLKDIAPQIKRVGVIREPWCYSQYRSVWRYSIHGAVLGLELRRLGGRDADELRRTVTEFAQEAAGGLISLAIPLTANHRYMIIALAARHRMPAIYPFRFFAGDGGLVSYGPNTIDPYRRAAGYIDRILKGELPVQAPTKFELVINLKTAKALGLEIPPSLLARADEVIE
jgi:putative ABC transport system substrate-binding protein